MAWTIEGRVVVVRRWLVAGAASVAAVAVTAAALVVGIEDRSSTSEVSYPVRASRDGASLVDADGDPFLYLADTVWLAPSRLDAAGFRKLLDVRAQQGFTTVQVSVLPFVHLPGGLRNVHGDPAVRGTDLTRPVVVGGRTRDPSHPHHDYWDHLDVLIRLAADRGMQVTLVPAWYGYRGEDWRGYVDERAALAYGRFLGRRLGQHPNLMWLLGGDNDPVRDTGHVPRGARRGDVVAATHAMARGIRDTEAVRHLMSYHASRGVDSVDHFADAGWHTFASAYSHALTWPNVIDSRRAGAPVVVTEALYDGRESYTVLDRRGLRAQAWWAVLGGAGFAYGHEDVWDLDPGHGPDSDGGAARWQDALRARSAADLTVLAGTVRDLLPLRPAGGNLLVSGREHGATRASAALAADRRTALVYLPRPRAVAVNLDALGGRRVSARWLDPATGERVPADLAARRGVATVRPPDGWRDAVLVLERA